MEPIPKDVIEMADDFFSHTDAEGKKNIMKKFTLEQPKLASLFDYMIVKQVPKTVYDNCNNLYLIVYRCYQYYGIKLSSLTVDFIDKKHREIMTEVDKKTVTGHTIIVLDKLAKENTNQNDLLDYIFAKLVQENGIDVYYDDQNNMMIAYFNMLSMIFILNEAMKIQMSKIVN